MFLYQKYFYPSHGSQPCCLDGVGVHMLPYGLWHLTSWLQTCCHPRTSFHSMGRCPHHLYYGGGPLIHFPAAPGTRDSKQGLIQQGAQWNKTLWTSSLLRGILSAPPCRLRQLTTPPSLNKDWWSSSYSHPISTSVAPGVGSVQRDLNSRFQCGNIEGGCNWLWAY